MRVSTREFEETHAKLAKSPAFAQADSQTKKVLIASGEQYSIKCDESLLTLQ